MRFSNPKKKEGRYMIVARRSGYSGDAKDKF
jgi:hypothetical protein